MPTRAMIIVAGGTSTRFGSDKLLADIDGRPLIAHTVEAVTSSVDRCIVVCRSDLLTRFQTHLRGVELATGGATRTRSEMAGLDAVAESAELIGIHDAARPVVSSDLIDLLFRSAFSHGGAVPLLPVEEMLISRKTHTPVHGLQRAQTPQVFRAPELVAAYARAARTGYEGHDTAEVVSRFSELTVVGVPGRVENVKVTYPGDLTIVRSRLGDSSRT